MKKSDWISIIVIAVAVVLFGNIMPTHNWADQQEQIAELQRQVKQQTTEIGELRRFKGAVDMVLDLKEHGDCCAVSERLDFMSGGGIFKYWEAKEKANPNYMSYEYICENCDN